MEHPTLLPRDEQYPLLKVDGGAGDSVTRTQPTPSIVSSRWNVTCANSTKPSWCSRWPEFVSACWMTIVLVAISFLVFYAWTINVYPRQPVVIVRCNESKPASDVFYHHIVSRDSYVPFSLFSGYLSFMARQYPLLRFYVYFLIDDSFENPLASRHLKFIKRLVPQLHENFFKSHERREIIEFQEKYQNVNISILYLSQYMAMTPLKYKWRTIALSYLPFYARIFATWQNGGIGLDLVAFNNQFNSDQKIDHRINTLLRQHNNGIESVKYADTFKSLDNLEDNKLFSSLLEAINQMLNETFTFFHTPISPTIVIEESNSLKPKNRTKRYSNPERIDLKSNINSSSALKKSFENNFLNSSKVNVHTEIGKGNKTIEAEGNSKLSNEINGMLKNNFDVFSNASMFLYDLPQVYLFYDTSGYSFNEGPSHYVPRALQAESFAMKKPFWKKSVRKNDRKSNYLSISPEGNFVATSSKHHPFLSHLFSSGCQRMNPEYAIKDTLISQCSGYSRDDVYCDNIRVIYDAI
ncbi:hypothetical protein KGM_204349 [Danaus plexippus plexippus]|uniref:Uncharacterized protein n=1 Tax=Danaus plexippus plexippus TaxID=278856 RepID=A0A212EJH2_DANPL|nr:hypothetical protein KGM_204349 [Danaus plexippus plexippus]